DLRAVLEPRTVTANRKLKTVEMLSNAGIPVHVMIAPVIPGLNSHEIFDIAEAAHKAGAKSISHAVVRLNGSIGEVFTDWVNKVFPDRADKVINGIMELHGGKLNDSRPKIRMKGEGQTAEMIRQMVQVAKQRFFPEPFQLNLNTDL